MLSKSEILGIFNKTGVIQKGHFLLSSGLHSETYLQCAQVLQYPEYTNILALEIADLWSDEKINLVIGPAIGGIIVSYALGQALNVRSVFTERESEKMTLRRGFNISGGERVLVVEDVVTTGGSVKEVIELLEKAEAEIIGISSLVDRSGGKVNFKYPFKPLLDLEVKSFTPDKCPLCKDNIPFTKPGSKIL
jgi:orotate phosphoribosyltransferase